MSRKILLMGGSFDPVHKGHIAAALQAKQHLDADEVWLIPSQSTPLKDRPLSPAEHRKAMLELAVEGLEGFKVCTLELDKEGISYTVDTLEQLNKEYPEDEFFWLIGADQAEQFENWKDPARLQELAQFVCAGRKGYSTRTNQFHFPEIEMESVPVSSSDIRSGVRLNYLDDKVLQYILDNELYLKNWVQKRVSPKRLGHSISVANLSRQLAEKHHLDGHKAYLAGLFHDVAKDMPKPELYKWMEAICPLGLPEHTAIWHGYVGASVADRIFGIHDPAIQNAIFNHVKGSSYDPLAMIVFIADKLDPLRGYDSSGLFKACMHDLYNGFMLVKRANKEFLEKDNEKAKAPANMAAG